MVTFKAYVEKIVRHEQLWLFCALFVLLIVAAVAIPNDASFTRGIKLLVAALAIVSFALTMSLGYYFHDSWKRRPGTNRRMYVAWLTFETIVGVPFAVCLFLVGCVCAVALMAHASPQGTITAAEAKSLVRVVLRHEGIQLSPKYCDLQRVDKPDKPFVRNYYSFGASCDYQNTASTTQFGIYVVSPRTGEIFEFNRCEWFRFPELVRLQQDIMRRTKHSSEEEKRYREATGCAAAKESSAT